MFPAEIYPWESHKETATKSKLTKNKSSQITGKGRTGGEIKTGTDCMSRENTTAERQGKGNKNYNFLKDLIIL